jgi:hypothetical protein
MSETLHDLARELQSDEVRDRFRTASIVSESPSRVRFRLDPGHVFERIGRLHQYPTRALHLSVEQRYRPDDEMTRLGNETVSASSFTADLRKLVDYANWWESGAHWRVTYNRQAPEWSFALPMTGDDAVREAWTRTAATARDRGIAHYMWRSSGELTCANNPPSSGVMFSVNPLGEWSLHRGRVTVPLSRPPDAAALSESRHSAAYLARQDLGAGAGTSARSGKLLEDLADQAIRPTTSQRSFRPTERRGPNP